MSIQLKLELISTNQGLKARTGNRSDVIVGKPRTVSKTSLVFQTDLSIKVVVNTIYELHKSLEFIQRNWKRQSKKSLCKALASGISAVLIKINICARRDYQKGVLKRNALILWIRYLARSSLLYRRLKHR